MTGSVHGWRRYALDAWPFALAVLLCFPLLTRSGYPLARDLIFVPRQPLNDGSIGLGTGAPRAVPLDAVVALLSHVVDGGVLARVVLPLILAAAGWGTHRLVRSLGLHGRLAAGGFAVWNPFVVERLALGQWALLAAYAALPWLAVLGRRLREGEPPALATAAPWIGLASLTPTGGLLGSLLTLTCGLGRARRTWWLLLLCVVLQLPWLLPSMLGPAALGSDPDGVAAFSSDADGPGGVLVSLLGLGGIWDSHSVPTTRESWWTPITAVVVVVVLVAAWGRLDRATRGLRGRLTTCAGLGLVLALLAHLPGGDRLLRWAMTAVPGAGLLRDGQKFLAPLALLVAVAVGVAVDAAARRATARAAELAMGVAILGIALPVALLPDGAATAWKTLDPITYPAGFTAVDDALDDQPGDLVTLPWRGYRGFLWGPDGLTASDPALRWYDRTVLVADDLQVGPTLVHGESPRGRAIGADLGSGIPVADALEQNHVTWALVYLDDPDADRLDLSGLERVVGDEDVELYRVPGATPPAGTSGWRRAVVTAFDLLALLAVASGGLVGAVLRRRSSRARRGRRAPAAD